MPTGNSSLAPNSAIPAPAGPVVLLVLDGVGEGKRDEFDAVAVARTPTLDALRANSVFRSILAHGPYVGLPSESDMGNSEVGHNTLGAGRIFDQGAKRIDKAIESGAIWDGAWSEIVAQVHQRDSALHLIGLLSDGNVHSSMVHLQVLISKAAQAGIRRVYVHGLLDGRDVPDRTGEQYVITIEKQLAEAAAAIVGGADYRVASGGGRMVTTMDRYEADWRIVERGWQAHVLGTARPFTSALTAISTLREETPGISDQLIPPFTIVGPDDLPIGAVRDGDAVIFFNFRGDRAIELSQALTAGPEFDSFNRGRVPEIYFAGMTLYDGDTNTPAHRLVEPEPVPDTISEYLAGAGVTQWAGAETQKFGHVTYFWNGNRSEKFDAATETYVEIPSDQVPFNERPWMKSAETADAIIAAIRSGDYRFIRANFPGGDMVGHTGSFESAVIAMESIDLAIGRIQQEVERTRGTLVITADHGNAEDMVERDKQGQPTLVADGSPRWKTAHSTNPIPLIIADYDNRVFHLRDDLPKGGLANVAATLIELLGYEAPKEFEPSLITE
ncbi:2,3-bisphosphoglycerate-independent phosphoglycerate mutase [Allocatelliglobosispora scoriae]|uniref:2,3-bisphosphoglycerate-independent phosphoglycerate mutase n=1 Tax=Allocatelliglobosispora scoriae TaxID=643052 RepID=A0A841BT89_9ACTN|nr:2,3-bisphosphoglycerate-independent phosphoglycerate mutase [Allocatelliglobosispora scoriae]MBB5871424.1 2,3-bisphosphoglycerate-independent phosphoglycerate mutase [Allocatelliglobosispora scoriae]